MAATPAYDPIHLEELQAKLVELRQLATTVRGKRVVLVVGITGSGKSTVINYLQGHTMKEVIDADSDSYYIDLADDDPLRGAIASPTIGFGSVSETKVPAIYECGEDFVLVDTAGFLDTHGIEANLANHVALSFIVNEAASVAGVITVSDFLSASTSRGDSFKLVVGFLSQFLADPTIFATNVSHIFTRTKSQVRPGAYISSEVVRAKLRGLTVVSPEVVAGPQLQELNRGILRIAESTHLLALSCLDAAPRDGILATFRGVVRGIPKEYFRLSLLPTEKALLVAVISKLATDFNNDWSTLQRLRQEVILADTRIQENTPEIARATALLAQLRTLNRLQVELKALPAMVASIEIKKKWMGDVGKVLNIKEKVPVVVDRPNPAVPMKQAEIDSFVSAHPDLSTFNDPAGTEQATVETHLRLATLSATNTTCRDSITDANTKMDAILNGLNANRIKYEVLAALAASFNLALESPDVRDFRTGYAAFTEPAAADPTFQGVPATG